MADATDPLSLVYTALWSMLEAHTALTDLVPIGNRVKYENFLAIPNKDVLQNADVPEVGIAPTGSLYDLQISSSSSRLTERYEAVLVTGDSQLAQVGTFLPVKWEILRAFTGWESVLMALTWESKVFVKLVKMGSVLDTFARDLERGITGWVSLLRFDVTMVFSTVDLRPS